MAETVLLAAGASAGTAATAGSVFSVLGTVGSAFGAIQSGQQQSAVYKAQASQQALAARQEELKGREAADNIRRALQANLASQNAIFAARGIKTTSGTPTSIASQSISEAARDIDTAMFDASSAAGALRAQSQQSRISASTARMSGYTKAAGTLYQGRDAFGSLLR